MHTRRSFLARVAAAFGVAALAPALARAARTLRPRPKPPQYPPVAVEDLNRLFREHIRVHQALAERSPFLDAFKDR